MTDRLQNFVNGSWESSSAPQVLEVINPASAQVLAHVPLSSADEEHRAGNVKGYEDGYFVFLTVLDRVSPASEIARTEVFGPVLSLMHAATIEEAIDLVNDRAYGNMARIFTRDGGNGRRFRYEAAAGNVGINVRVAAPMSTFPFSGWGESFFVDLHAQAHHAVELYMQTKVVVERWPREWTRKF